MAIAIDGSTPLRVTGTGAAGLTQTTAAFNPPASILLACLSGDGPTSNSFTMSNNGAALTWTQIALRNSADASSQSGVAQGSYAVLTAGRTGMTVTYTFGEANDTSMKLYVVTGFDTATPIGGSAEGSATVTNITTASYTSQVAGSYGFVVFNDFNAGAFTSSSDSTMDTGTISTQITYGAGYKTIPSAGASVTHNIQLGGTPVVNYVLFEVRPDPTPPVVDDLRLPVQTLRFP